MTSPIKSTGHMRVTDIARLHGISESYVRRLIREGRLDVDRLGRSVFVTTTSVENLFAGGK